VAATGEEWRIGQPGALRPLASTRRDPRQRLYYASFAALVDGELGMSKAVVNRLVGIAEHVSRPLAEEIGQSHAWALVRLAMATPADDTADELPTQTLSLPTGEKL
jgi:hypothetical protein